MKTIICFLVIITAGMMSSRGAPSISFVSEDTGTSLNVTTEIPVVGAIAEEVTVTLIETQENYANVAKEIDQVSAETTMVLPQKSITDKAEMTSMEIKDGNILRPPILTVLLASNLNLSTTDVSLIQNERNTLPGCTVASITKATKTAILSGEKQVYQKSNALT